MKDSRCSTRKEDWKRFGLSLIGQNRERIRHHTPVINYFFKIGHTGKNIIFEEWRRWTGYCD